MTLPRGVNSGQRWSKGRFAKVGRTKPQPLWHNDVPAGCVLYEVPTAPDNGPTLRALWKPSSPFTGLVFLLSGNTRPEKDLLSPILVTWLGLGAGSLFPLSPWTSVLKQRPGLSLCACAVIIFLSFLEDAGPDLHSVREASSEVLAHSGASCFSLRCPRSKS